MTGDQVVDVNSSELWVSIDSGADYDATVASIEDVVDRTRGVDRDVVSYSAQKIRDVGALGQGDNPVSGNDLNVLTGSDDPLVVRVYGQDLATLRREATQGAPDRLPGRRRGRTRASSCRSLSRPSRSRRTSTGHSASASSPATCGARRPPCVQGIQVGSIFEQQKVFDVIVKGVPATRKSVASVRNLLIDGPDGGHLRLSQVADVRVAPTPIVIERDAVSRHLDIVAGVSGRSLGSVATDIEDRLANVSFPLEYHAEVLQESTGEELGGTQMIAFAIAAAIAAFLLLQAAFRSWGMATLAFLTLPVALVGGVAAALIGGAELSLGSFLGFLALLALAARTGVVLIRHFQDLEREGESFGRELVERGARERFAPILTSALATAVVMLPFVIAGSPPGLEVVHPMAVVVLGGLVTSTLLSLFVLPALYLRFGGRQPAVSPEEELMQRWAGVAPASAKAGEREPVV